MTSLCPKPELIMGVALPVTDTYIARRRHCSMLRKLYLITVKVMMKCVSECPLTRASHTFFDTPRNISYSYMRNTISL